MCDVMAADASDTRYHNVLFMFGGGPDVVNIALANNIIYRTITRTTTMQQHNRTHAYTAIMQHNRIHVCGVIHTAEPEDLVRFHIVYNYIRLLATDFVSGARHVFFSIRVVCHPSDVYLGRFRERTIRVTLLIIIPPCVL